MGQKRPGHTEISNRPVCFGEVRVKCRFCCWDAKTPGCWGPLVNTNSGIWAMYSHPQFSPPHSLSLPLPAGPGQPKYLSIPSSTPTLPKPNAVSQDSTLLPKYLRCLSHSLGIGLCNESLSPAFFFLAHRRFHVNDQASY